MLVVVAHPKLSGSRVNRALTDVARGVAGIEVLDLYDVYADFRIDVAQEQRRIDLHDTIVLQHPLYWYSAPPLLKQWIDLTFVRGFAYGREATGTRGKTLASAVTCGAPQRSYGPAGWNKYPVEEFLRVFEVTAEFCSMIYAEAFITYDTHTLGDDDIVNAAVAYRRWLSRL